MTTDQNCAREKLSTTLFEKGADLQHVLQGEVRGGSPVVYSGDFNYRYDDEILCP